MWKKDLKLPENYHEDIIKYELLLKKEINKETIITILSLYSNNNLFLLPLHHLVVYNSVTA